MPVSTQQGHWALKLVTAPASELLDLASTKSFLRVDDDQTEEDSLIAEEIAAARQRCERVTGRALLVATWRYSLDHWPAVISPPLTPLKAVTYLKYIATDGTLTTLSTSVYTVDTDSEPGRVTTAWSQWWPAYRCVPQAVQLTFTAGYTTAAEIPDVAAVRNRMRTCVAYCYRNREERDEVMLDGLFASLWNGVL